MSTPNPTAAPPSDVVTVTVDGDSVPIDGSGLWKLPTATGGPHRILVTRSGFAPAEVVNVRVPPFGMPAGIQVSAPLAVARRFDCSPFIAASASFRALASSSTAAAFSRKSSTPALPP